MSSNKDRLGRILTIYLMLIVAAVYLPLNFGWIQPTERFFYDSLIRLRPSELIDERIVIVCLTESDISSLREVPVSDRTLAQLIVKLRKYHPGVIGLDLHRNVPVGEGWSQLQSAIKSTPQLVGVEKTSQGDFDAPEVAPNPELQKKGMSGASDLIDDGGDIIRRGYLYVRKSAGSSEQIPSFSLKVALQYLEKEDIKPIDANDSEHNLKLGNTVFPRLKNNQHFYSREDIDDYQILINYPSAKNQFKTRSFSEILNNDLSPELLQNKIVLIGVCAPTVGDDFFTPYSRKIVDFSQEIFGVEIQAIQTSQIISAVLDRRKIIQLLPWAGEFFWLLIWLLTPAIVLVTQAQTIISKSNIFLNYISINILIIVLIILIGYLGLIQGYWIPIASPIIALLFNVMLGIHHLEITKQKQFSFFLSKKLSEKTQELEEIQFELIAKEKLEAYEKLSVKMAHEIRNYLNSISIANDNCQYKLEELKQILAENSFLFEGIYESDEESPSFLAEYFAQKFTNIEGALDKIALIIESILTENLADSEPEISVKNINELIIRLVDEFSWQRNTAEQRWKPHIELNLASDLPPLQISALDLERVLLNLLNNACDSEFEKTLLDSEHCSRITVTTSHEASQIKISVKDNALGIRAENLEQIFAPFWTTKNAAHGVGVGLFFSKQRIEKYHGTLTVQSREGEWTEFTITFPV